MLAYFCIDKKQMTKLDMLQLSKLQLVVAYVCLRKPANRRDHWIPVTLSQVP